MTNELRELNHDIWLPFSLAYAEKNADRYLDLHAPDFVWVQAERGIIERLDEYQIRIRRSFADLPTGVSIELAFRFTERIAGAGLASERGIARMSGSGPKGPLPVRHASFHTIARRDNLRWRFVLDYEGGAAEASDFGAAHPVDDLPAFGAGAT